MTWFMSASLQGRGIWLFNVVRGAKGPQLVSDSVTTKFIDANEDSGKEKPNIHLLVEPSDADELSIPVDANMRYTTYSPARVVTFFHKEEGSSYVTLWVLKFPATTKVYAGFVEQLKVGGWHMIC
jgi:hypothetical protein